MIFWNQKEVLFSGISEYVNKYGVKSVLDIGAGDGNLALKISNIINDYTAIENDNRKIENLRKLRLKVIKGNFPAVKIAKKYDLVLSSHSVPENIEEIEQFLKEACRLVKSGGLLLIITFKGGKGDVFKLKEKLKRTVEIADKEHFEKISNTLRKLGKIKIKKKISTIKSDKLRDIIKIVRFSLGNSKNQELKKKIISLMKKHFKTNGKYLFKFEHLFLSLKKYGRQHAK